MEISVKQMMAIENKGQHGFLKKFMMENAGSCIKRQERFGDALVLQDLETK